MGIAPTALGVTLAESGHDGLNMRDVSPTTSEAARAFAESGRDGALPAHTLAPVPRIGLGG